MILDREKIKLLMLDNGLTQRKLADSLNVTNGYISKLLNGKVRRNRNITIIKIARVLGVNPSEIVIRGANNAESYLLDNLNNQEE